MVSDTLVLGTHKGLLILQQRGNSWQLVCEAFRGVQVTHAMVDPRNGTLWACLNLGHWGSKLHRSRDMGSTWEEIPAPQYPEGTTIEVGFPGAENRRSQPATLSYLWCVTPGGQDQPDRLYIGSEPGGVFQSDDGGETWALNEALWNHESNQQGMWFGGGRDHAGSCSIIVDPRDSNHLIVGISVGGVFESRDGGKTWVGRNKGLFAEYMPNPYPEYGHDPHYVVAAPSNPDVLWQQNHCGVFRSVDSGQNWENISQKSGPVKFGFALAVDEKLLDTAWVVPAISDEIRMAVNGAMCVARTEDGGRSWAELRSGLPQEHCYDLVFRHALDISGDRLAFGTTTGNLYVSDNRGDHWQSLGYHWPPVYSVRFVKQ